MKKITLWSLLIVLVLVLAACGGGDATGGDTGGDAGGGSSATIEASDTLKWLPANIEATTGEALTINITGGQALEHNFQWADESAVALTLAATEDGAVTRTFDAPGTYDFYCTTPGHKEAGMVGAVTVN